MPPLFPSIFIFISILIFFLVFIVFSFLYILYSGEREREATETAGSAEECCCVEGGWVGVSDRVAWAVAAEEEDGDRDLECKSGEVWHVYSTGRRRRIRPEDDGSLCDEPHVE